MSKFALYQKGDSDSFRLPNEFLLFPQFVYYLRRSQFISIFNYSPDETAFFRSCLLRENVTNALSMIQPLLYKYTLNSESCEQAMLELSSRHPDCILLLDTFFSIIIWMRLKEILINQKMNLLDYIFLVIIVIDGIIKSV